MSSPASSVISAAAIPIVSTHRSETGVTGMPIFREPFVLACPEDHPACAPDGGGWEGLTARERLLLDEGHCLRDQALAACSDIAPSNRHATSLETLKYMVAAGEGCTLIPIMAANDAIGIKYAPLPIERYSRMIHLVWRHSDPRWPRSLARSPLPVIPLCNRLVHCAHSRASSARRASQRSSD